MEFIYSDGGRSKYFKGRVGDCVVRAIANATGKDYKEIYDGINRLAKGERTGSRKRGKSSARNGVYKETEKKYIEGELGWVWVPLMGIGTGCQVHLSSHDLPAKGNYIVRTSRHLTCVKDGKLYNTYDCTREGTRCVYGYWREPTSQEREKHAQSVANAQIEQNIKDKVKARRKAIKTQYAKKIAKAKRLIVKLERERDKKLSEIE